jgi:hypothetical protein
MFRLPPPAFSVGTGVGKWSGQSLEAETLQESPPEQLILRLDPVTFT